MMGSGKSTIGRRLSDATGWPYIDNDELVRGSHGASAREILAERGEDQLRRAESDALARGIELPGPALVGVAAGTILDPANRELLRAAGLVVWLRADAEALESRARGADHRPFLDSGGESWIRRAVEQRDPLYASVAGIVIDTGRRSLEESAADLLEQLGGVDACRIALRSDGVPARDL